MTIRMMTAGESHGPKLTGIIEGLPAGFNIDKDMINDDLLRRQQGFGRGGRMKIETDTVHISSGVVEGKTTGAPVAVEIINLDYKNWIDKDIDPMSIPRPGHADFAGAIKYNHDDIRISLERASARETAIRTALGSICKQILKDFDIVIMAYVIQVGHIKTDTTKLLSNEDYLNTYNNSLKNEFAFPDLKKLDDIKSFINQTMKHKDTLGGVFETIALGLPPGLGSYAHFDRRLDGLIAQAMISIPAMKALEIGDGINNSSLSGTNVHDEFIIEDKAIKRLSNKAGGLEGGMSNGMPLVVRVFMKPISTTLTKRQSVNLKTYLPDVTVYERSDFCAVQRAAVIGESMLSFILLNALVDKIGGDCKKDMHQAYAHIRKGSLYDLNMKSETWRFNYDKN